MYLTHEQFKNFNQQIIKATLHLTTSNCSTQLEFESLKIDALNNSNCSDKDFKLDFAITNKSHQILEDAIAKVENIGSLNLQCSLESLTDIYYMTLEEVFVIECSNKLLVLISKINKKHFSLTLESVSEARFGDISMELLNG